MSENSTENHDLNDNQNTSKFENPKPKKSKKGLIIIIILLLLVIILSVFSYFLIKKPQSDLEQTADYYTYYQQSLFPIEEYNKIEESYKNCIIDVFSQNNYLDGEFFFTKVPNRAKKVFAFGNFSGKEDQSYKDIAYLIEKNDFQSSRLFIESNDCLLIYSKMYDNELPTISAFKKGQKIYLDEMKLIPSPTDGIMLHFKYKKMALLYIPESKNFEEFTQYSDDDIKNMQNESDEGEGYEEEATIEENQLEPSGVISSDSIK